MVFELFIIFWFFFFFFKCSTINITYKQIRTIIGCWRRQCWIFASIGIVRGFLIFFALFFNFPSPSLQVTKTVKFSQEQWRFSMNLLKIWFNDRVIRKKKIKITKQERWEWREIVRGLWSNEVDHCMPWLQLLVVQAVRIPRTIQSLPYAILHSIPFDIWSFNDYLWFTNNWFAFGGVIIDFVWRRNIMHCCNHMLIQSKQTDIANNCDERKISKSKEEVPNAISTLYVRSTDRCACELTCRHRLHHFTISLICILVAFLIFI